MSCAALLCFLPGGSLPSPTPPGPHLPFKCVRGLELGRPSFKLRSAAAAWTHHSTLSLLSWEVGVLGWHISGLQDDSGQSGQMPGPEWRPETAALPWSPEVPLPPDALLPPVPETCSWAGPPLGKTVRSYPGKVRMPSDPGAHPDVPRAGPAQEGGSVSTWWPQIQMVLCLHDGAPGSHAQPQV